MLPPGPHSYIVLWTQDYCRGLRRAGDLGSPLEVVYGGAHSSQPLISRYGVGRGDTLYAVSIAKGQLLVVGGMTVDAIVPWRDYIARRLGEDGVSAANQWHMVEELHERHPEWGHRLPWGCPIEAVTGGDGAALALDRVVPADVVGNLFFVAKNGTERQVRQVHDGRITPALGLQGHVLRLRADGAQAFRALTWPRG